MCENREGRESESAREEEKMVMAVAVIKSVLPGLVRRRTRRRKNRVLTTSCMMATILVIILVIMVMTTSGAGSSHVRPMFAKGRSPGVLRRALRT